MESPINWKLAGHPMNYLVLFLMVLIAGIAVHFVLQFLGAGVPASSTQAQ